MQSLDAARRNAQSALVSSFLKFSCKDMFEYAPRLKEPATVLINPPYGERLKPDDLEFIYEKMGETLKEKYQGCTVGIISSSKELLKRIGLKPTENKSVYNGALDSIFSIYKIY